MPIAELAALAIVAGLAIISIRDMLRVSYELWTAARIRRDDRREAAARIERGRRILEQERERNRPPAPRRWGAR